MAQRHVVRLSQEERKDLEDLVYKGKVAAHKRLHAQILLKADVGEWGESRTDGDISDVLGISTRTVERIRQRLVLEGLEAALNRAPSSRVRSRVIDGENEAHLIALTCSEAPEGRGRWTLRLLGQRMVELGHVANVSHETIRQVLKKRTEALAEQGMVHSGTAGR
jgi:hypothetical protein